VGDFAGIFELPAAAKSYLSDPLRYGMQCQVVLPERSTSPLPLGCFQREM